MRTTVPDSMKAAALKLYSNGMVTKTEAARLAGVSKQTFQHWARDGLVLTSRDEYLAAAWEAALSREIAIKAKLR